ncbi:MAG: hypothetical protein V4692_04905, partial [Bdellovibrionota bacterium]
MGLKTLKTLSGIFFWILIAMTTAANALVAPSGSSTFAAQALKESVDKRAVIDRLKKFQDKYLSETTALDTAIKKRLQDSLTLDLGPNTLEIGDRRAVKMTDQIQDLSKKKEEAIARREIVDRLIFAVDTKYTSQPFKTFLEQQFIEMASNDLTDGRDGRLWKAFTYLSIAVRE